MHVLGPKAHRSRQPFRVVDLRSASTWNSPARTRWAAGDRIRPSDTRRNAVPTVGCPANGSSLPGVKILRSYRSPSIPVTKAVSENPISTATARISSVSRSAASGTTHNWFPARGRSANTSRIRKGRRMG